MSDYDVQEDIDSLKDYIDEMRDLGLDTLDTVMLSKRFPMIPDLGNTLSQMGYTVVDDLLLII